MLCVGCRWSCGVYCLVLFVVGRFLCVGCCPLFVMSFCLLGMLCLLSFVCLLAVAVACLVVVVCLVFGVKRCLLWAVICSCVAVRSLVPTVACLVLCVCCCLLCVVVAWLMSVD